MMESLIVGATLMLVLLVVVAEILVGRKGASRK